MMLEPSVAAVELHIPSYRHMQLLDDWLSCVTPALGYEVLSHISIFA